MGGDDGTAGALARFFFRPVADFGARKSSFVPTPVPLYVNESPGGFNDAFFLFLFGIGERKSSFIPAPAPP